ncbi:MAG: protein phosphatase 2C domain-containing protein [Firmicutes bacterium]|nr:protein phosphatase 2C domain-containing protein [Bacillota bacterium]
MSGNIDDNAQKYHIFDYKEEDGLTGVAVTVQGKGHIAENKPCEDFSGAFIRGRYLVYAVADGHSCCSNSQYGAKYAVESVKELVDRYTKENYSQEDMIRAFRSKSALKDLLDIWFLKVYEKESSLFDLSDNFDEAFPEYDSLTRQQRLNITTEYGTTLLSSIVCDDIIICFAIGDGGLYMLNRNYKEMVDVMSLCDFGKVGDAVNTSMCDLNVGEFLVSFYPKSIFDATLIMSDGVADPWQETGRFEKINELREKYHGEEMDSMLYGFVVNHAHQFDPDDDSLVFGEF